MCDVCMYIVCDLCICCVRCVCVIFVHMLCVMYMLCDESITLCEVFCVIYFVSEVCTYILLCA